MKTIKTITILFTLVIFQGALYAQDSAHVQFIHDAKEAGAVDVYYGADGTTPEEKHTLKPSSATGFNNISITDDGNKNDTIAIVKEGMNYPDDTLKRKAMDFSSDDTLSIFFDGNDFFRKIKSIDAEKDDMDPDSASVKFYNSTATGKFDIETSKGNLLADSLKRWKEPSSYKKLDSGSYKILQKKSTSGDTGRVAYVPVTGNTQGIMYLSKLDRNNNAQILKYVDTAGNITTFPRTVLGGKVMTEKGMDSVSICKDEMSDIIRFDSSMTFTNEAYSPNDQYTYVITDQEGKAILGNPGSDSKDFNMSAPDICKVWGVAYKDGADLEVDSVKDLSIEDDSVALSTPVTVFRDTITGGSIMSESGEKDTVMLSGSTEMNFDSTTDATMLSPKAGYIYAVTDKMDDKILGTSANGMIDFSAFSPDTVHVWGLSYSGMLSGTDSVGNLAAENCFDLSDSAVTVIKKQPIGGKVRTEKGMDSVSICKDGSSDTIRFDSSMTFAPNNNYTYVITDQEGEVILGNPDSDFKDFNGSPAGICKVWGVAYKDGANLSVDSVKNLSTEDDSVDLSTPVTVFRDTITGGSIMSESGEKDTVMLSGSTVMHFDSTTEATMFSPKAGYIYAVTDKMDKEILGTSENGMIDFSSFNQDTVHVHGLSYSGTLSVIDSVGNLAAENCFNLSDSAVTVIKKQPIGGKVMTENGMDSVSICKDGMSDIIRFDSSMTFAPNNNYTYVITDQEGEVILGNPDSDFKDFDGSPAGICKVWGVAYKDGADLSVDSVKNLSTEDDSVDLSTPVTVFRDTITGGSIMSENGEKDTITVAQSTSTVNFDSTTEASMFSPEAGYTYAVTDKMDKEILGVSANGMIDFDGIIDFSDENLDTVHVWGISHSGSLSETDSVSNLSAGNCYNLSDSSITILEDMTTGVQKHVSEELAAYPNPANNQINIVLPEGETGNVSVTLTSLSGKKAIQTAKAGKTNYQLNVSDLSSGIYILKVQTATQVYIERVIIE